VITFSGSNNYWNGCSITPISPISLTTTLPTIQLRGDLLGKGANCLLIHQPTGNVYRPMSRNNANLTFHVWSGLSWSVATYDMGGLDNDDWLYIPLTQYSTDPASIIYLDNPTQMISDGFILNQTDYLLTNRHSQANPTWTDIIGNPADIAATFPNGVEGQWIPFIPTGSTETLTLNRKCLDAQTNREYAAAGSNPTWTADNPNINNISNTIITGTTIGNIQLNHYETQAHFTSDDVNSEVVDLGGVVAMTYYGIEWGAHLTSSLLGKVSTNSIGGSSIKDNTRKPLNHYNLKADGHFHTSTYVLPSHDPLGLGTPTTGSIGCKELDYLSSNNGVGKLCYAYKEMIYDTTWGDNNQFEIVDNQESFTDDNGNTGLRGTASFNIQYFIDRSN